MSSLKTLKYFGASMRIFLFLCAILSLAGCGQYQRTREPDDFKPYVTSEMDSIPMAYGDESWVYPQGTSPQQITARWKTSGLIMKVLTDGQGAYWTSDGWRGWSKGAPVLRVFAGPNFYNLAPSSQRGLAHAVAQMYGVGKPGRHREYILMDDLTNKPVGTYTRYGLQMY